MLWGFPGVTIICFFFILFLIVNNFIFLLIFLK